jgi:hypothetical protein
MELICLILVDLEMHMVLTKETIWLSLIETIIMVIIANLDSLATKIWTQSRNLKTHTMRVNVKPLEKIVVLVLLQI